MPSEFREVYQALNCQGVTKFAFGHRKSPESPRKSPESPRSPWLCDVALEASKVVVDSHVDVRLSKLERTLVELTEVLYLEQNIACMTET